MGISSPIKDQLKNLSRVRNLLLTEIEINKVKLDQLENNINDYGTQITQLRNEIVQFQYSLTKDELEIKAKKIISLENDKNREKKNYDMKLAYNENLKDNLNIIGNKIDEIHIYENLKESDKLMKILELINTSAVVAENAVILLKEKEKQEESLASLKITGGLISENKTTPDDILKELLGDTKNSENGGFY